MVYGPLFNVCHARPSQECIYAVEDYASKMQTSGQLSAKLEKRLEEIGSLGSPLKDTQYINLERELSESNQQANAAYHAYFSACL